MSHRPRRVVVLTTVTGLAAAACLTLPVSVASAADGCSITNASDFNGDGYDDAVVGDPYATVNGKAEAGAIVVLYGDADGRIGEGKRAVYSQGSVPGSSVEAGDHFGWSVAVADVTNDNCTDILIGSPDEDWQGHVNAGIAHVISFTPDGEGGPGTAQARVIDQGDVDGVVEAGDQFGTAVALSDYYGGDEAFGAISAPREDLRGVVDAGVVNTFGYDSVPHMADQREQGRLSDRWLPGTPEAGDRFGASLIIAPLQVTSGTDVAIEPSFVAGAPGDTVVNGTRTIDNAGSITTWDLITAHQQQLTQDSAGVPGAAEAGDQFGFSLAFERSGPLSEDSRAVVVGSPGEDVGKVGDAGSVTVLTNNAGRGLDGRVALTQNTDGFDGSVEAGDRFGHSVALRPHTSSRARLAVGVPHEDMGSTVDAGMVNIADIAMPTGVTTAVGSYTEHTAGTPGTVARSNRFGLTVSALAGKNESLVAVSSPYQRAGSVFLVDAKNRTRSWVPGLSGVPSLTSGRFGWSVAGPDN